MVTNGAGTSAELQRLLADLRPGDHLCMFYDSDAEWLDGLMSFLRGGLAQGECCLCVVNAEGVEPVLRALEALGLDTDAERERGALCFEPADAVYLRNGAFDPEAARGTWRRMERQALAAGFTGLRAVADVPVEVGLTPNIERWHEYEAGLNDYLAGSRTRILCQYDLRLFGPRLVLETIRAHPTVVLGRGDAGPERVRWLLGQMQRLRDSEHEARALHRASLAISGELDLDARLERVLDAALELTGVEHARIILEAPARNEVEVAAVRGALAQVAGYRQPRGVGITGIVMEHNRPVISGDIQADPRTWDLDSIRRLGIRSWLAVPLADGERPFGVLVVASESPNRFSEGDETRLMSLGALAGSAIREARLRRQLEQELDERKRAEGALFRREQELRAVVETAPDVITRVDRDLRYVYVNSAFERVQGLPAEVLLGKVVGETGMAPEMVGVWRLTLQQVFATGREQTIELDAKVAGVGRVFQIRAAPEFGPDGRVEHVVTVARDITERTRREEEQARIYRELIERDERLQGLVRRALLAQEQEQRRRHGLEELEHLTRRERDVLTLLARGLTTRQIAEQLVIGPGTVKGYIERVLSKLGAANRAQAAARAIELGLLDEHQPPVDLSGGDGTGRSF